MPRIYYNSCASDDVYAVIREALPTGFELVTLDRDDDASAARLGVSKVDTLDELLRRADIVTLHVPLTAQTRHLINAATLHAMKRGAILINTARGPIVDEHALKERLESWPVS